MSLTSIVLKFAAAVPQIEDFERYLFVGPHPDDIEIGAGATAAKLASEGKQVAFLICLDGRFGGGLSGGIMGDELAALRRVEAVNGAKKLGVQRILFLGRKEASGPVQAMTYDQMNRVEPLCDGGFYRMDELEQGITDAVTAFQPDVIFGPDPWSCSECHTDHLNVGNAVKKIACFAPYPGIMRRMLGTEDTDTPAGAPVKAAAFYMTARPNRYVRTSGKLLQTQMESILAHGSQFPKDSTEFSSVRTYLKLRSINFGIRRCCGYAEGFRVYGQTHMHCLPEAGE